MSGLQLSSRTLPVAETCDLLVAPRDFLHVDRIPRFNILIYVLSGCIHVTEQGTDHAVHPGELLLLRAGVHQYGKKRIAAGTKWIYVHFHLHVPSQEVLSAACTKTGHLQTAQYQNIPRFLSREKTENLEPELFRLLDLSRSNDPFTPFSVSCQLYRILLMICQNDSSSHRIISLGDEIAAYLQNSLDRPFISKELEAAFHLTYKHMEAVFKRHTGSTIQQYHTRLRVIEAARELRSTGDSVQAIGYRFGFHDPLYFSRCFKKHMGFSPKRYREVQLLK